MKKIHLISACLLALLFFDIAWKMDESADISRGWREHSGGRYDQAITDFNLALKENPRSANAYFGLAVTWEAKGDYEKSKQYFSKAVEIDPEFGIFCDAGSKKVECADILYAWRARSRGRYGEAIANFNHVLRKNPQSAKAYYGLAITWEDKGDYDKALEFLSKAIEIEPEAKYFYLRALVWLKKNNCERAIEDNTSAINTNPTVAAAYINRAYCYRKIGKLEIAVADYDKVLELTPDDKKAHKAREEVLAQIGKSKKTK